MQEDRGSNVGGRTESAGDAGSRGAERLSEREIELRARSMREREEGEEGERQGGEGRARDADPES